MTDKPTPERPQEGENLDIQSSGAPSLPDRQARIAWLAQRLAGVENGGDVVALYAQVGHSLSLRQARADLVLARDHAAAALNEPGLGHWSEAVTGGALRQAVREALDADPWATVEQIRAHIVRTFERDIGLAETRRVARIVYH